MGKSSNGVKAGVVAGIVFGIISVIFVTISLIVYKTDVLNTLQQFMSSRPIYASHGYTALKLYNTLTISEPVVFFIGGLIVGLVLGLLFSAVEHRMPGKSLAGKGLVFGIILWIIVGVLLNVRSIGEFGPSYFALIVIGSLLASLAYGVLLGKLYDMFEGNTRVLVTEPTRSP